MSSIFSQYKEQHPELAKAEKTEGTSTPALNLPVKCSGYEGDVLVGIRLDTEEEVRIKLKTIEQNPNSKFKRIEIKEFADPKNKKHHAAPGKAVFVAENCYLDKDGTYSSRWLKVISADPQQTAVHVMNASLLFIKKKDKDDNINEIIFAKTAFPERAKIVNSVEELSNALSGMLNPKHIGSNPICYVRIKDTVSGEVEFIEVSPLRTEREDGNGKKCVEGSVSAEKFMSSTESQMIRDLLEKASDQVSVDVIPAAILYPGSSTKENMVGAHPNAKKILEESFYIKNSEEDNTGARPEIGYLKCIIATRKHADGTSYFTFIKPVQQFLKPTSVKSL